MRGRALEGAAYLQACSPRGEPPIHELPPSCRATRAGSRLAPARCTAGARSARRWTRTRPYQRITASLRADPNLEVGWDPQLTVVAFRLRGGDEDRSRQLLERINATKRVFLSSTLIRGEYWLRVCIVSHRTHVDRIDECATIVRDAAAALA